MPISFKKLPHAPVILNELTSNTYIQPLPVYNPVEQVSAYTVTVKTEVPQDVV